MNIIIKSTLICLVAGLLLLLTFKIASESMWRQEGYECEQWKQQASDYKEAGFYLTGWQKAQCDYHGISIDAPVH